MDGIIGKIETCLSTSFSFPLIDKHFPDQKSISLSDII